MPAAKSKRAKEDEMDFDDASSEGEENLIPSDSENESEGSSEADDDEEDDDDEEEEDEDSDEDEEDEDELLRAEEVTAKPKTRVKTYPSLFSQILSKYEKPGLIGYRAQQIATGAEVYVQTYPDDNPVKIAERELKENKLPYFLKRKLPDGTFVSVKLDQLLDIF